MKYYNLLFNGVETNKRPLNLTNEQFEEFKEKMLNTAFEIVLHPNSTQIEWFTNLPIENAKMLCDYNAINPRSVSVNDMIFLHKKYSKKH